MTDFAQFPRPGQSDPYVYEKFHEAPFNLQFMMYTSRFFLPSRPPEALLHGLATARIIDTATKPTVKESIKLSPPADIITTHTGVSKNQTRCKAH